MNNKSLLLILVIFLLLSLLTIPRIALQNDDASGYALTVRNTIHYNQWLAPMLTMGDPTGLVDKPPLGIWLLAWLPKLVGLNEITIHIPNVLYYLLLLLVLFLFLTRFKNKSFALNATLIAATSLCLVVYSRTPKLEVLLTLFLLTAHLFFFGYLKEGRRLFMFGAALAAAGGFLVKTGLGILPLILTALALILVQPDARKKIWQFLLSWPALVCLVTFLTITGSVLGLQSLVMNEQWPPYWQSILIKSPYNPGYLGFGFYPSIIGFLLITIFPWTPLFLTGLKFSRTLTLGSFSAIWFWSNFLFLLFCYKFTDLRTFTAFVPPMAILATIRLEELLARASKQKKINWGGLLWQLLFLFIFAAALIMLLIKPYNGDGISLSAAIPSIALFTISLAIIAFFYLKPSTASWAIGLAFIAISYIALFYNTKPLVESFNPNVPWPSMIKEQLQSGRQFIIYRPPDRARFMSPDLFYVDFMAGPADRYVWNGEELIKELVQHKAIVLTDTQSWQKLNLKRGKTIAKDNYSRLVVN